MYEININITLDSCHFLGINLLSIMLLKLMIIYIILYLLSSINQVRLKKSSFDFVAKITNISENYLQYSYILTFIMHKCSFFIAIYYIIQTMGSLYRAILPVTITYLSSG